MALNSLSFAAFFLIFLAVLLILPKKLRKIWLLAGNCMFYLSWERWSIVLLLLSSLMVWECGLLMSRQGSDNGNRSLDRRKTLFLVLPVVWNVGLLVFFRYTGLIGSLLGRAEIPFSAQTILVPLGLSFYTLRCIGYVADVYRGKMDAVRNPLDVLIYVSFFPQIISGPIEQPMRFFSELEAFGEKNLRNFEPIWQGFLLFVWGLFQKIVLAERLSVITARYFGDFQQYGFWELLVASLAYTLQIYCDFGGYSDMSRGIARMIGFSTMRNFRQPYLAAGIKNFWRRWHISLTSWLTDHVYIPLGGSRKGSLRKYLNILIVFAASGLWHGSTLNFVFWGLLHAVFQIAEDLWNRTGRKLPVWLLRIITLAEVNFAWIFFNAGGLNRGFRIIRQMFSRFTFPEAFDTGLIPGNLFVLGVGLGILLTVDMLHERGAAIQQKAAALPLPLRWLIILGLFWSVIMLGIYGVGYDTTGFIYAQF
ncbi:MAG: MBOAT family protein [Flexilinea sp.]|nr:MBOAT family protein [Flexilinea sp.]